VDRKTAAIVAGVAAVGGALAATASAGEYVRHVAIVLMINVVMAGGLHLIIRSGQLSLAHGAFMGIGAYTYALSAMYGLPNPAPVVAGVVVSGMIAYLIGAVVCRMRGVYFVLATFAFGEIARGVLNNWSSVTRGATGLSNIPGMGVGTMTIPSRLGYAAVALVVAVAALGILRRILVSNFGWRLQAIAQSELLAESIGVDTVRDKVSAFVIGSCMASLGGVLYASYVRYVSPVDFTFWRSVDMLTMNVVGGMGGLAGAALGAVSFSILGEGFRGSKEFHVILYGALLITVIRFAPDGLLGMLRGIERRVGGVGRRGRATGR
jgi:branched-chain amino acid transport system permease protein